MSNKFNASNIPSELLCEILRYLPPGELGKCVFVCQRWKKVIRRHGAIAMPRPSVADYFHELQHKRIQCLKRRQKFCRKFLWLILAIISLIQIFIHSVQIIVEFLVNDKHLRYLTTAMVFPVFLIPFCILIKTRCNTIYNNSAMLIVSMTFIITHDCQIITNLFVPNLMTSLFLHLWWASLFLPCGFVCEDRLRSKNVFMWAISTLLLYLFDLSTQFIWYGCTTHVFYCFNCTIHPELASCRRYDPVSEFPHDLFDIIWLNMVDYFWTPWILWIFMGLIGATYTILAYYGYRICKFCMPKRICE